MENESSSEKSLTSPESLGLGEKLDRFYTLYTDLAKKLDELNGKHDELSSKFDRQSMETRSYTDQKLDELNGKHDELSSKFDRQSMETRSYTDQKLDELNGKYDTLSSKFDRQSMETRRDIDLQLAELRDNIEDLRTVTRTESPSPLMRFPEYKRFMGRMRHVGTRYEPISYRKFLEELVS